MASAAPVLVIACGALAREIVALQRANGWTGLQVQCLPPELHNRPEQIPAAVRSAIREGRAQYEHIFVAYADCGTGGQLDAVLAEERVERLPGAHCYQFYAGAAAFTKLADEEPGTFYLTDFLVRHFDRLVIAGLGLDAHPELRDDYFGNYRRLVYLVQSRDAALSDAARAAAARLGLAYEERITGYGELATTLAAVAAGSGTGQFTEQRIAWHR
ncbi:MAG TPA: DUF1638 domain-containing protein [Steroidobacteraceae bacterium]